MLAPEFLSSVALIPIPKLVSVKNLTLSLILLLVHKASHLPIYMHMCAVCVKLAMSTVEEASSSDSLERKKRSMIWSFFVIDNEDKTKAVCLTCKEKSHVAANIPSPSTPATSVNILKAMKTSSRTTLNRKRRGRNSALTKVATSK